MLVSHDDCTVTENWIAEATKALNNCPNGMVTGRVLPGGDDPLAVPSTITWNEPFDYTGSLAHGVLYPNNMAVNRNAALEIGGFDERDGFLTAAEDLDFSYRWLKKGKPLHYQPKMVVTHNDWRSPDELVQLYKHYARCAGRYYGKHWYQGDRYPLTQGLKDIYCGLKAWLEKSHNGTQRWHDQRLELPIWIPIGVIEGLIESRKLEKHREKTS